MTWDLVWEVLEGCWSLTCCMETAKLHRVAGCTSMALAMQNWNGTTTCSLIIVCHFSNAKSKTEKYDMFKDEVPLHVGLASNQRKNWLYSNDHNWRLKPASSFISVSCNWYALRPFAFLWHGKIWVCRLKPFPKSLQLLLKGLRVVQRMPAQKEMTSTTENCIRPVCYAQDWVVHKGLLGPLLSVPNP